VLKTLLLGQPLSFKLKGRPFVVVVVRQSVTDVLWLNGAR